MNTFSQNLKSEWGKYLKIRKTMFPFIFKKNVLPSSAHETVERSKIVQVSIKICVDVFTYMYGQSRSITGISMVPGGQNAMLAMDFAHQAPC
jgi:hypothetical protein